MDLYGNVVYYIYWFDKYGYNITNEWNISLFAREIVDDYNRLPYKYECSNGTLWDCCIPFEGNECLLETAENPEK